MRRFPQPARVGDLIGMPVLDLNSKTLGYVRQIVRNSAGEIQFIIGYSPLVGVVRTTGRSAAGSARYRRRAIGVTRQVPDCTVAHCYGPKIGSIAPAWLARSSSPLSPTTQSYANRNFPVHCRFIPACCARVTSGHAAAMAPTNEMNSRRLIRSPRRRARPNRGARR